MPNLANLDNSPQRSKQWFEVRRGVFGASQADKIITPTGVKSRQLEKLASIKACEVISGTTEKSPTSYHMNKGTFYEPHAIKLYEEVYNVEIEEVGFLKAPCGNYGCSVDGAITDMFGDWKKTIEIKNKSFSSFGKYSMLTEVPKEYKPQTQFQLLVTGLESLDFVYFNEHIGIGVIEVKRDNEYIAKLEKYLKEAIALRDTFITMMITSRNITLKKTEERF
jgi:hypothetical protein